MDDLIQDYIKIKTRLQEILQEMIDVYLSDIWANEFMYLQIMREMQNLLKSELIHEFPDFPVEYLPRVKLRVDSEDEIIEAGIQQFLNQGHDFIFLGNADLGSDNYDFYCKKSFDLRFDYIFYARYGHSIECVFQGTTEAAAEYMAGKQTPLSVAFGMAVEDGFIS